MSFELNQIRIDTQKQQDGVWYELGEARFLVARLGNANYRKIMGQKIPEYLRDTMEEILRDRLIGEVLADTILLGWESLTENGADLPYTKGNCRRLMTAPEYSDLRDLIVGWASNAEKYRVAYKDETKKNSAN